MRVLRDLKAGNVRCYFTLAAFRLSLLPPAPRLFSSPQSLATSRRQTGLLSRPASPTMPSTTCKQQHQPYTDKLIVSGSLCYVRPALCIHQSSAMSRVNDLLAQWQMIQIS